MLIRSTATETVLQCDRCGDAFHADLSDCDEARLMAEDDGWSTTFENDQRRDYCALCGDGS
jgi:ribosomal protein L37E